MTKTIRPKPRPQKSKLEQGYSLVPRTRSKAKEQELERGDVEFRSDLQTQLWYNPLARLGYDPSKVKTMPQEAGTEAMYIRPAATKQEVQQGLNWLPGSERVNPDDVVFFSGTSQSPIVSHELSHRGFQQVAEYYNEDPEFFKEKYGQAATEKIERIINPTDSYNRNEALVELFDDLDAVLNIPSDKRVTSMEGTRDVAFRSTQEEFQKYIAKTPEEDRWGHRERDYAAEVGILKAAEDLLKAKGEPPKTEPDYPNFLERTLGFRFAEGGMVEDNQMKELFQEDFGAMPQTSEPFKGKGYVELLVDNIVGLDNDYESFGEAFGKSFNEDELGTLKNMAMSAYEGAKEFVTSPIETTKDIATEISNSVYNLGTESLDGRLRRMYGVGYQDATEDQVTQAREAVIGDAMTASSLIPSARGVTTAVKAVKKGVPDVIDFAKRIEVDPNALGSMGGNIRLKPAEAATDNLLETVSTGGSPITKKKSEINPLFKPKNVSDENLVTFYSPLRSAIEEMQFSKKGKSGQEIMAYLNKRAPNINKGEIAFSRLNLDPKKNYSKAEVLDNLQFSTDDAVARYIPLKDSDYSRVQIQNITDPKTDYFEVVLESKNVPEPLHTHHTEQTFAHSRSTVHTDPSGQNYIVVNEMQSDPLQNLGKTDEFFEAIPEPLELAQETFNYLRDFVDVSVDKDILEFGVNSIGKNIPFRELKKQYKDLFGLDVKGTDPTAISLDALRQTAKKGPDFDYYEFEESIEGMYFDIANNEQARATQSARSVSGDSIPFKGNTEYVKNLLLSNIAVAKNNGINTVVVPSVKEIARLRAKDFDGSIEAAERAFKPVYVDAVKKAVRTLNNEYKGRIKLGTKDINYNDLTEADGLRKTKGLALDITNFDFDPTTQRVRFAEGGEVKSMEEQMSLFKRGGLADGGLDREPVTGNEVPPGSMPSEVRDDVPAQLSEGEYVVPADVVRYYGVKFFEDLRTEAKNGMMKMDQEGRIGGTAVDTNGVPVEDDTLSPEEEQMLMEALAAERPQGMAIGGMVRGYSTAGDVTKPTYTPTGGYGAGPMQMQGYGQSGSFEARQYVNTATGQIRTFQFLNGMPISMIPAGFVPATQEAIDAAGQAKDQTNTETTGTGQATGQIERDGPSSEDNLNATGDAGRRQKDPTSPFGIGTGEIGTGVAAGLVGGALTGGFGGALGFGKAGMQAGAFNESRNSLVDAMLSGDKDAIAKAKEDVTSTYGQLGNLAHVAVFNEGKTAKDAIAYVEKYTTDLMSQYSVTPGPNAKATIQAAVTGKPATTTAAAVTPAASTTSTTNSSNDKTVVVNGVTYSEKDSDRSGAYSSRTATGSTAPTTSPRPQAPTATARTASAQARTASVQAGNAAAGKDYGPSEITSSAYSGKGYKVGRATGGLVGKPSKNPPKKKAATKGLGGRR